MADFCKQCSIDTFGEDFGDMEGLSKPIHTLYKRYSLVLCEQCGLTLVDHTGRCVVNDCLAQTDPRYMHGE